MTTPKIPQRSPTNEFWSASAIVSDEEGPLAVLELEPSEIDDMFSAADQDTPAQVFDADAYNRISWDDGHRGNMSLTPA